VSETTLRLDGGTTERTYIRLLMEAWQEAGPWSGCIAHALRVALKVSVHSRRLYVYIRVKEVKMEFSTEKF
jgi:predicted alpha/beta-fold hydrolase